MRNNLLANSGDLHFGLGAFVLCNRKVKPDINNGHQEEGEEGRDQQQRLEKHRESKLKRVSVNFIYGLSKSYNRFVTVLFPD